MVITEVEVYEVGGFANTTFFHEETFTSYYNPTIPYDFHNSVKRFYHAYFVLALREAVFSTTARFQQVCLQFHVISHQKIASQFSLRTG